MPQADITYDAPYNRRLVSVLKEMDEKHWEKAYPAYHPNPLGYRLGNFHGEYPKVGGGSSPLKYNPAGNSTAYPPANMRSGFAVQSGGAYADVDGAVGGMMRPLGADPHTWTPQRTVVAGNWSNDFGNVMQGIAHVAPHLIPLLGVGRHKKYTNAHKKKICSCLAGMGWSDDFKNVMQGVAHVAPHLIPLLGEGRTGGKWSEDFKNVMQGVAHVAPHIIPLIAKSMSGEGEGGGIIGDLFPPAKLLGLGEGGNWSDDLLKGVKTVAPLLPLLALGRPKKSKKGAGIVDDVKSAVSKAIPIGKEIYDAVPADIKKAVGKKVAEKASEAIKGLGRKGGKNARAEIVKKVMREKGMKMIEASKYVKAHNLY